MSLASDLDLILIYDAPPDEPRSRTARARSPPSTYYARLSQRLIARDHRADRRGPPLRGRYAAAAVGRVRADRLQPRRLRRISARSGLDLGAYGADPRPAGRRRRRVCAARIDEAIAAALSRPRDPRPPGRRRRRHAPARSPTASAPLALGSAQPARRAGRSRIHRAIPDAARGGAAAGGAARATPAAAIAALGEAGSCRRKRVRELARRCALLRHVQALLALLFDGHARPAALTGAAGATLARCAGAVDFARLDADIIAACARVRAWYDRLIAAAGASRMRQTSTTDRRDGAMSRQDRRQGPGFHAADRRRRQSHPVEAQGQAGRALFLSQGRHLGLHRRSLRVSRYASRITARPARR